MFLVHRGWDPSTCADVTRTCLTLGMILNTIGWTVPLWGPRVQAVQAWCADHRRFRKLRPLWDALYRAHPETSLQPAPAATSLPWHASGGAGPGTGKLTGPPS
ncbi:hypothetical protein RCO28_35235 [Streptomyces sp. LHD-70]|uniref:DUF6545 domain-containing protein n=1 Tax=Streptomyces sp. LHD-70 TaxID=3072140 RepID=UPI00280CC997|nr:DUF6545 domain-containing protein [Streptomyces sp. LHD-70]MDQ8707689.1 hypothetical protein [Streptomyces sp. LHD-70]